MTHRYMEAIFGILHFDERWLVAEETLRQVTAVIGAIDPVVAIDGSFGLAVSRKVLDPACQTAGIARDPSHSRWAAMTGELDNRAPLERELAGRGGFEARRDAEIALAFYHDLGAASTGRLEGFFNLVIWDSRSRRLLLSADRCGGVRALYYARDRGTLVFGSALKAVVAHRHVPREMDRRALEETLALGHAIAPHTLLAGVKVLPAGTLLECQDGDVSVRQYWRPSVRPVSNEDPEALGERYFAALNAAVARALDTRAEIGVLLSGGVDSAALVSLIRHAGQRRIKTFSVHIGESELADAAASGQVAEHFQTEHRAILDLDEGCLDELPSMIWHYEAPAQSIHPTYWLCQAASQECDLVIGGYGNDLVWGCYAPKRWLAGWPAPLVAAACRARYLRNRSLMRRWELWRLLKGAPVTSMGLLGTIKKSCVATGDQFSDMITLNDTLFGDQRVYRELGKLAVDAASLSVRLPYADEDVKRIAESVPRELRMETTAAGSVEFKSFFKSVMSHHEVLPLELIYQRKTWMRPPTARWLRGPLGRTIGALLLDRRTCERAQLSSAAVAATLREHQSGAADHSVTLMSLAALELWQRIYIDPAAIARPDAKLSTYAGG
ncbi:MAG: asparagine synthase-related protein [Acidobacteriota bacterium]